ncbi:hypothetical protein KKG48_03105 [Patescibacteria group bacterium]|nr:hypothetical protein [Patescibacteria group bacterium]MCG2695035.1 hypothetical protein [Candidatus Parcubacteria bacterium]
MWLIGVALYWAEGSKEKDYRPGSCISFINSDPDMVKLFLVWLIEICKIRKEDIKLILYIHENHKNRIDEVKKYWLLLTGFEKLDSIYFKKHNIKTIRKRVNGTYYGGLNIKVKSSSGLVRKIAGWVNGINK